MYFVERTYGGQYHLFYQHNPYGRLWGNMRVVSPDLSTGNIRKKRCSLTWFSGCAVVDHNNVSGLKEGDETQSCSFTPSQCLAYSTDGGKTLKKYDKN